MAAQYRLLEEFYDREHRARRIVEHPDEVMFTKSNSFSLFLMFRSVLFPNVHRFLTKMFSVSGPSGHTPSNP